MGFKTFMRRFSFLVVIIALGYAISFGYTLYHDQQLANVEAEHQRLFEAQQLIVKHKDTITKMMAICAFRELTDSEKTRLNLAGDDVYKMKIILTNIATEHLVYWQKKLNEAQAVLFRITQYRKQRLFKKNWDKGHEKLTMAMADEIIRQMSHDANEANITSAVIERLNDFPIE